MRKYNFIKYDHFIKLPGYKVYLQTTEKHVHVQIKKYIKRLQILFCFTENIRRNVFRVFLSSWIYFILIHINSNSQSTGEDVGKRNSKGYMDDLIKLK